MHRIQLGREEAAEECGGMDEGHQQRYDAYNDREQLLYNAIAHEKGEYEYAEPMSGVAMAMAMAMAMTMAMGMGMGRIR